MRGPQAAQGIGFYAETACGMAGFNAGRFCAKFETCPLVESLRRAA